MRECNDCKRSDVEFGINRKKKDGLNIYCKSCARIRRAKTKSKTNREQLRQYSRNRRKKGRALCRQIVQDHLRSHSCTDCGESDIQVLEFDHLRDKAHNISQLYRYGSLSKLKIEIAKCEVVCANCHRRRTYSRSDSWRTNSAE
jgi:hypothetical protein